MKNKRIDVLLIISVLVVIGICVFLICKRKQEEANQIDFSNFTQIEDICQLATLKCYYHNVIEYSAQPGGLFKYGLGKYGYKKLWMEYDGIIKLGINVSKVKIEEPDENNYVKVYIPDAEVQQSDTMDDTLKVVVEDTGIFTEIDNDLKAKKLSESQKKMENNAKKDTNLLEQAQRRAKIIFEEYITNTGKQFGKEYKVKWLDKQPTN